MGTMRITRAAVALLIVLAAFQGLLAAEVANHREQVHFSAEDPDVETPIKVPEDVMAILRKDEFVRNVLQSENIAGERLPASWFSASAVHLNNAAERDVIVVGRPPLAGANVVTFWIFRAVSEGYHLVPTAPAHDLFVRAFSVTV
jgi:hypothetical protein